MTSLEVVTAGRCSRSYLVTALRAAGQTYVAWSARPPTS